MQLCGRAIIIVSTPPPEASPVMKQTRPSPYPRRSVCAMLVAALCFGTPGQAQGPSTGSGTGVRLPTLGDSVSDDLDVVAERKLGDQVMRQIRPDPDVLDDPLLLGYVQSIWDPLLRAAQQRGDIGADTLRVLAWETFLVRDRSVNAFALPGGFVGVYLGLINITATRDELAAVMAHELAHVTQRHIARAMTSNSRQSLLGMAAMLAAVLAASKSNNASAAQAAVVGGQALLVQGQLNFSRDMEREADRVGFGIFSGAAYAPGGVAAMFEKLESANRLNDSGSFPYLRSHPLTVERIGDARARVEAAKDPRAADPQRRAPTDAGPGARVDGPTRRIAAAPASIRHRHARQHVGTGSVGQPLRQRACVYATARGCTRARSCQGCRQGAACAAQTRRCSRACGATVDGASDGACRPNSAGFGAAGRPS